MAPRVKKERENREKVVSKAHAMTNGFEERVRKANDLCKGHLEEEKALVMSRSTTFSAKTACILHACSLSTVCTCCVNVPQSKVQYYIQY